MTKILIAYFSHEGQNYSHGGIRNLPVGNTEGLAINGDKDLEKWVKKIGLK